MPSTALRHRGASGATLAVVVTLAGGGATTVADADPSSVTKLADASLTARRAQGDPKCQPVDLGIHYAGGEGATAMALDYFQFVNVSRHECHLLGYPGVAVYDRTGRRLRVKVTRSNFDARPVREVRLRPGRRATFEVETAAERAKSQHCVFAARERFTPPNDVGTLSIKHRLMICFGVSIGPVKARR